MDLSKENLKVMVCGDFGLQVRSSGFCPQPSSPLCDTNQVTSTAVLLPLSCLIPKGFCHWDAEVWGTKGAGSWAPSQPLVQSSGSYCSGQNAAACLG